jgi:hypothetical protein
MLGLLVLLLAGVAAGVAVLVICVHTVEPGRRMPKTRMLEGASGRHVGPAFVFDEATRLWRDDLVTCAHCARRFSLCDETHYKCAACRAVDVRLCVACEALDEARHGHDGWIQFRPRPRH